jgi:hypothetical protein
MYCTGCIQAFSGRKGLKGLTSQGSRGLAGRRRYGLYHSGRSVSLFPAHSAQIMRVHHKLSPLFERYGAEVHALANKATATSLMTY